MVLSVRLTGGVLGYTAIQGRAVGAPGRSTDLERRRLKLAVVAYPRMASGSLGLIESFRASHDPQAGLIGAHITLVFPVDLDAEELTPELQAVATTTAPFSVSLSAVRAAVGIDGRSYALLESDRGGELVSRLHDRLYSGALARHVRSDIRYEPHVTVGSCERLPDCVRMASEFNAVWRPTLAHIDALALLDLDGSGLREHGLFTLRGEDALVRDPHRIVSASPGHVPSLPAIERAAARLFRDAAPAELLEHVTPESTLLASQEAGTLWVALGDDDEPVGFARVEVAGAGVHLAELDVHPTHGRRGIGTALVRTVEDWARSRGFARITLTTYRDIPWNAPFYASLGFVVVPEGDWDASMRRRFEEEAGLDSERPKRVVMTRHLVST